ncbi:endonuclease [Winogradskyella sp. DF17]|uniref:Endonuclease n=1 Tax=Winogradskyella pelagia TaxID=2819984 RepID=A0ABS3SZZ0_9FLAO|nr:endonuclease [Winogradskyella sp. DF17]MBO3116057.1 endonuclease [Winogradskyella sp. DF17]
MKYFYTFLCIGFFVLTGSAQVPSNYYDSANGLSGYALKSQLKRIINDNTDGLSPEFIHNDQGDNLDGLYGTSDLDLYYENDGTILDIYSENPSGPDPYNYFFPADECAGNFNSEGDCYNKEHIIPKSTYNEASPMVDDGHTVIPTDGRVNGLRSNLPFGVVDDNQLISQNGISNPTLNGSKAGGNLNSGYSAGYTGTVFEPLDEFKGDVARMYFYFVTRYEDQVSNWSSFPMFDGSSDKVLEDPFLTILLTWHTSDPVSQKEIDRNNVVFNYQNNRNPFVDNPNYVALIWSGAIDDEDPDPVNDLIASNPTDNSIELDWTEPSDNVGVTSYDIYIDGALSVNTTFTQFTVTGLVADTNYCFTIKAKDAAGNESDFSDQACETTTNNGSGTTECAAEDFQNMPANDSQYTARSWVGTNGAWNATRARTDQTISGSRAIAIDYRGSSAGSLVSPTIAGGIGSLTVTTQRVFAGTNGSLDVLVNGTTVGTIAYSDTSQNVTLENINLEGSIQVTILDNDSGSARVALDNLSWTCYSNLSLDDAALSSISIYPNPVKGDVLYVAANKDLEFEIYSILGQKVSRGIVVNGKLNVSNLKKGIYIIKLIVDNQSKSYRLIRQ